MGVKMGAGSSVPESIDATTVTINDAPILFSAKQSPKEGGIHHTI